MPPSTHFFTQAAFEPRCLAPHIVSEIQPLILVESAALAASAVRPKNTTSRATARFIGKNLLCVLNARSATIMPDNRQFGKRKRIEELANKNPPHCILDAYP